MEAEASRERARLQAAVEYIEALNVAQARMQRQDGRYVPLNALVGLPSAPVGFIPRLLVDQWSYVVSLKDYFDACGFALFSDERGVIYETHARPATRQGSNDTADEQ